MHLMSISGVHFMLCQYQVYISCYANFRFTFPHVQFRRQSHVLSISGAYFMSISGVHFMSFQFQVYNISSCPFKVYILYHVNFSCVFHVHCVHFMSYVNFRCITFHTVHCRCTFHVKSITSVYFISC